MTDTKGNIYTTETYRGQRVQRFVYKGLQSLNALMKKGVTGGSLTSPVRVDQAQPVSASELAGLMMCGPPPLASIGISPAQEDGEHVRADRSALEPDPAGDVVDPDTGLPWLAYQIEEFGLIAAHAQMRGFVGLEETHGGEWGARGILDWMRVAVSADLEDFAVEFDHLAV